ncbi:MAG TPA: NAD(P)H-hydrate dehydratase [Allosphingosinicella sp.]|nr:NAD(P)H-hydrate dehydratase [Allosphingosinicella sp.]
MKPILTAAAMRAAEGRAIAAGTAVETLMDRAGTAAAEAIRRYSGLGSVLVLCGPGNNGGDGYVIARRLREAGLSVRVAALGAPKDGAAALTRQAWGEKIEELAATAPAPVLVDALFGTGLTRGLDDAVVADLHRLAAGAQVKVAVDLPSGVATDDGALLSPVPDFDLTITIATLKPAHRLQPAARHMGRVVVADIGIAAESDLTAIERPHLPAPGPDDHKYSRGYAAILAGEMPGASALAASAAARAGAGYVRLIAQAPVHGIPHAVVQAEGEARALLADGRIDALAVGPGLGRTARAEALLERALGGRRRLVLDADALVLLARRGTSALGGLNHVPILTPHAGEFARLHPDLAGSKVDRARDAAADWGAVIVFKGSDTVVAAPDGRAAIAAPAPAWLASAGTGDVLTGITVEMRARGLPAFEAACAAVWLHACAAEIAGPALVADDLVAALPSALALCL